MLQRSTNPPQIVSRPKRTGDAVKSPLDVISAAIQPIEQDNGNDLLDTLCYMKDEADVLGMIELYEAYSASAERLGFDSDRAQGRAHHFLNDEFCQAWSKAYLVADFLKEVRPPGWLAERYAQAMLAAAVQMGANLEEVAAVVAEIASWKLERPQPRGSVR